MANRVPVVLGPTGKPLRIDTGDILVYPDGTPLFPDPPMVESAIPVALSTQYAGGSLSVNSATTAYYWRITMPMGIVVNRISLRSYGTGFTTGNTFDIAVFTEDGQSRLIHVTTPTINAGNTTFPTTVAGAELPAGDYYIGFVANGTINLQLQAWSGWGANQIAAPSGRPIYMTTTTVSAGVLPSTIDPTTFTYTNINPPILRFDT